MLTILLTLPRLGRALSITVGRATTASTSCCSHLPLRVFLCTAMFQVCVPSCFSQRAVSRALQMSQRGLCPTGCFFVQRLCSPGGALLLSLCALVSVLCSAVLHGLLLVRGVLVVSRCPVLPVLADSCVTLALLSCRGGCMGATLVSPRDPHFYPFPLVHAPLRIVWFRGSFVSASLGRPKSR